eukprot:COSAG06_NODE_2258_length_7221_cov_12.506599_6_plen_72_part_00
MAGGRRPSARNGPSRSTAYLTDQSGSAINLQNSTFQATLRIYYPDPIHPRIGEAGAELDDTVGLKDVTFRY